MELVIQFLQTYVLAMALGGLGVYLITRPGAFACALPRQRARTPAAATTTPVNQGPDGARWRSADASTRLSVAEVQARLAELRAEQDRLARRISSLDAGKQVGEAPGPVGPGAAAPGSSSRSHSVIN